VSEWWIFAGNARPFDLEAHWSKKKVLNAGEEQETEIQNFRCWIMEFLNCGREFGVEDLQFQESGFFRAFGESKKFSRRFEV
jgi:hypothetical protein